MAAAGRAGGGGAAGAWYLYHNWPKGIERFDARFVPLMLLVPTLSLAANGWLSCELILEFDVRLSFVEWYGWRR